MLKTKYNGSGTSSYKLSLLGCCQSMLLRHTYQIRLTFHQRNKIHSNKDLPLANIKQPKTATLHVNQ